MNKRQRRGRKAGKISGSSHGLRCPLCLKRPLSKSPSKAKVPVGRTAVTAIARQGGADERQKQYARQGRNRSRQTERPQFDAT